VNQIAGRVRLLKDSDELHKVIPIGEECVLVKR
jgi:hypothetical protein